MLKKNPYFNQIVQKMCTFSVYASFQAMERQIIHRQLMIGVKFYLLSHFRSVHAFKCITEKNLRKVGVHVPPKKTA